MEEKIPDVYCDGVKVTVSPFDIILQCTERKIAPSGNQELPPETVAYVRTSLGHAKILAILLRKLLKQHEDQAGPISIHPSVLQQMGISLREDW